MRRKWRVALYPQWAKALIKVMVWLSLLQNDTLRKLMAVNVTITVNLNSIMRQDAKQVQKWFQFLWKKSVGEPKNWTSSVGMILGGELYIDMSGDLENRAYLCEQMDLLRKELQSKGIQSLPGILCSYFPFQYCSKKYSF